MAKQEKQGRPQPALLFIQQKQKDIFFSYFLKSKIIKVTRIILKGK